MLKHLGILDVSRASLQRPKKSELSGWQLPTRKNFPGGVRKSFSRQKKYLKLQFDVQVRIICCFCNVLSSNHAWLYILGKAHTQLPFLTHLILVPSLGCVFLMRTCYRLIKIRQKGWIAIAKLKPLSLFISVLLMLKKALDNVKMEK